MQVYGVKDPSLWPSPLNAAFNVPGSTANMLGTPVHALLSKFFSLYVIFGIGALPEYRELYRKGPATK